MIGKNLVQNKLAEMNIKLIEQMTFPISKVMCSKQTITIFGETEAHEATQTLKFKFVQT
jgi:hypothetical protein